MEENKVNDTQQDQENNKEQEKKAIRKAWISLILTILFIIIFLFTINACYNINHTQPYTFRKIQPKLNELEIILEANIDFKELNFEVRFYDKDKYLVSTVTKTQNDLRKGHLYTFIFEYKFTDMLQTHNYEHYISYKIKFPISILQSCIE